ncbi:unnamed protein product [Closterium sp. NIES-54]
MQSHVLQQQQQQHQKGVAHLSSLCRPLLLFLRPMLLLCPLLLPRKKYYSRPTDVSAFDAALNFFVAAPFYAASLPIAAAGSGGATLPVAAAGFGAAPLTTVAATLDANTPPTAAAADACEPAPAAAEGAYKHAPLSTAARASAAVSDATAAFCKLMRETSLFSDPGALSLSRK